MNRRIAVDASSPLAAHAAKNSAFSPGGIITFTLETCVLPAGRAMPNLQVSMPVGYLLLLGVQPQKF